jgi:Holliday junction resolvase RusA-like endonuclease
METDMTTRTVTFVVNGRPQQRGSKRATMIPKRNGGWVTRPDGRPMIVARDDNERSKDWMRSVADAAREAWNGEELYGGAVKVTVQFHFARPKGHYGSGRNSETLKPAAPTQHTQKPDLDKLQRAILDACTGQIWRDDCQVCQIVACKDWTEYAEHALVQVEILG